jgi:alpha-N-acetylglucosaminidase
MIVAVLDAVFKEQGVSQAGMDAYFSGPAFLAWNRMRSNMRGWGGPLSAAYIQGQAALQRQILARMADFDITPAEK